jgi:hypothetical protein
MNAARVLSMLAIAVVTAAVCVGLGSDAQQRSDVARPMPVGAPIACIGDLNDDGVVNVSDLLALLGAWGPNPGHAADLNGDGVVNVSDLLMLLGAWGDCPGIPPGTVYTELNYIDPPGNGCPDGLCTNGIGGALNSTSYHNGTYYSPGTFWTQSQDGFLEQVRVIVYGQDSINNPTYVFQSFEDFAGYDFRVEIWPGFESFAASPHEAPIKTSANLIPVNENKSVPIGYTSQGHPNFEWVFDVSSYNFELQGGQDYILVVRALGSTGLLGWVLRSASSAGSPADVAASTVLEPGFVDQPPYNWPVNRLGTEIRVRTPSGD